MCTEIKYEMQSLEDLHLSQQNVSSEYMAEEVARIKRTLLHQLFAFNDDLHLRRYIRYHQQGIVNLMDRSAKIQGTLFEKATGQISLFNDSLGELLGFIESNCSTYFDFDGKAPDVYSDSARREGESLLHKLREKQVSHRFDARIVDLFVPVLTLANDRKSRNCISYRQVKYAHLVHRELRHILNDPESINEASDINEGFQHLMCFMNLNSKDVMVYLRQYYRSMSDGADTTGERIEKLLLALKRIKQIPIESGVRYSSHAPALKDWLIDYLAEEIFYFERLARPLRQVSEHRLEAFFDGFKLKFEASVSQLAYLTKIFLETKFVVNDNVTQVLQFLVKYIVTKRSEDVSYGSLRAKFYNVERGTKESVRHMLEVMIKHIDKD